MSVETNLEEMHLLVIAVFHFVINIVGLFW